MLILAIALSRPDLLWVVAFYGSLLAEQTGIKF